MELLDPREARDRALLALWLEAQRQYALHPEQAPPALRRAHGAAELARAFERVPGAEERAARDADTLARVAARAVPIASPLYPERLRRLTDAPVLLLVRGNPALLLVRGVAIVGARAATGYGLRVARELAAAAARGGLAVVSGLARGIDGAAHGAALEAGGASVAFLPCGIERVYPPSHRRLAGALAANGALVSEFPPDTAPRAPYFPLRNRLISALSEAVVVVEGRVASGTLTTARHAANQGVDVLAVPGPIHSPTSAGPHQLIRDGAGLVTSGDDLLASFGIELKRAAAGAASAAPLSPLAARTLALLHSEALTRDEIASRLRASEAELAPALLELELAESAKEDRDGTWCAT
ncbi:MAG: DNA-protecting protein DprA [Deltaproteobacteria bacterium]|nr:DNA-protecting protein DprA [Deltaproteobacteria bacterium]